MKDIDREKGEEKMKFLHLADLHIGKRVNEFSMLEDQKYILNKILSIIDKEEPEVILIAGDVYDKSIPAVEGITLFDEFLTGLHRRNKTVCIVSGNHDSAERLNFAGNIIKEDGIYMAGVYKNPIDKVNLEDEYGKVTIYLLPFVKPAVVRKQYEAVESYHDAVKAVLEDTEIDSSERNVLISHQFVINGTEMPEESDSETKSVGGLDYVDVSVFEKFDYVALGHLHRAQKIKRETIRYAGSPLKYSFSEIRQKKSVVLVDLKEKGQTEVTLIPLKPLHEMREMKGSLRELLEAGRESENCEDYIHAILTDEEELYDPLGELRAVYPNMMKLDFDNSRTRNERELEFAQEEEQFNQPAELFASFFEIQNGRKMTEQQEAYIRKFLEEEEQ